MSILDSHLEVEMPDQSKWMVPVRLVAESRARYYAEDRGEFDGDVQRSLDEDTVPLFEDDHSEIIDWAANNMDWDDVAHEAFCSSKGDTDFQEGWCNGEKKVVNL